MLIPGLAGMSGVHYPTFAFWNVVGAVIFSGILFFPASVTRNYQTREVLIPRGAGVETIAGILKADGLVESPTLFVLAARVLGHDRNLKAGRTPIESGPDPRRGGEGHEGHEGHQGITMPARP